MGVVSGGCQERGETGAGAAAAVATGKDGSGEREGVGEGRCHTGGWVVRKTGERRHGKKDKQKKAAKNKGDEGRKKLEEVGVVLAEGEVRKTSERREVEWN